VHLTGRINRAACQNRSVLMAKITFIILAHENADHVADLANLLTEWNPHANAVIHYDLNAPAGQFEQLKARVANSKKILLVKDRLKCGWGTFSLVDAVVRSLKLIRREQINPDRVMLISGGCMPIRPLAELSQFLDNHPETEFIEAHDSSWMVGGLRKERYQYWHLFNHQTQPKLFNWHFQLQKRFWPKRRFPRTLEPRFGSQWWCLSWTLCEKILDHIEKHPGTYRFFSTTWIPDELFFQTMAFRYTHIDNLAQRTLTFFHFNDWGKPIVLLDDHVGMIKDLPFFFARKVSSSAKALRAHLIETAKGPAPTEPSTIDLKQPFAFPYREKIAALPKASPLTPALFQNGGDGSWAGMLETCPKSFVVLYGPQKLVRRASDAIRGLPGLTVFGRLFHPTKVDFGPGVEAFRGLHADDDRIRDFGRPSYFARVLDRVDNLAVFEMSPGDDPDGELALMLSRNAIFIPVVPEQDNDIARQLYWTLSIEASAGGDPGTTPIQSYRAMQAAIDAGVASDHRRLTDACLDAARRTEERLPDNWQAALRFRHGDAVLPLVEKFDAMQAAVNATGVEEMVADLPEHWQQAVRTLSDVQAGWRLLRLNFPLSLPEAIGASELPLIAGQSGHNVQAGPVNAARGVAQ
jgi:hypothetical protein